MKKLIDVHHHVFPPGFKAHTWNIKDDQEAMERLGIDGVLLSCPLPVTSGNVREINEFMAENSLRDPERYGVLASIPFDDVDNALAEIEYAQDVLKADGFAVPSNNNSIYISDDRLNPVFEELNRRKAVIFLHPSPKRAEGYMRKMPGCDDSVYEYVFETTRAIMDFIYQGKMLKMPDIKWITAHAGGTIPYLAHRLSYASEWHAVRMTREEILPQIKSLYYDLALSDENDIYTILKSFAGASHIVFGTDYPPSREAFIARSIKGLADFKGFSEEEKQRIHSGNICELFPRFQN